MSGPQCCENPPTLDPSSGAGHVEQLGGLDAYVVGSQDSKLAIVLLSDIFGYEAPNFRKLADKVAAAGFYVVAPDYFYGDSYDPENAERPIPVWVKDHGVESGFDDTLPVVQALKSKGISKIGAAGFCWGGKGVVELGKRELIQAGVLLHPALVTPDDIEGVKVPIAVLGAEIDETAPPELLKQFEEVLTAKSEVDGFVKVFPKTTHGWTVRYKDEDEAAAMEAHSDMIQWFVKYVK
ncbi:endo-1,3;1,4-beta-D-glucanase-like isoform X1 [Syzygium oleosum]|uniref:endo-1,3;1,4-beta-D-glucanase-like isoform X1 n=1 Tax=Syzygium oleosum TaxID=219896 RepID=UPI0024BBDE7F|nr:endo-1,3;1,4-beta-D-glucanase-like isoform X1 [Syzygium oleosum]